MDIFNIKQLKYHHAMLLSNFRSDFMVLFWSLTEIKKNDLLKISFCIPEKIKKHLCFEEHA